LLALFAPTSVKASVQNGLKMTVYDNWTGQGNAYNNAPPIPPTTPVCLETTASNIDWQFDQNPVCGINDDFVVKFEGFITAPETGTYTFDLRGDDGTRLFFGEQMVEDFWRDTGNGGQTFTYSLSAGESVPILAWYYENGGGAWVKMRYQVSGVWTTVPASWFTQTVVPTTTTTLAPYLNTPQNLQVTAVTDSSVSLSWDAPEQSNADVERYAVMWSCETNWDAGWAIATYDTNAIINGIDSATSCIFQVRADNDTIPVYSSYTSSVTGVTETTTTTTTSTTTTSTTTTTEPETTTTTVFVFPTLAPVSTEDPVETPPSQSDTESTEPATSVPQYAPEQETTTQTDEPAIVVPEVIQDTADAAVSDIFDTPISDAKLADAVDGLIADAGTPEELTAIVNSLLDQELTDTQFAAVIDSVFSEPLSDENFSAAVDAVFADTSTLSDEQFNTAVQTVFDEPLTTEQFGAALDAVFDEPISDEKFDAIIDAVLDEPLSNEQFDELVNVLESDTVTEEQVAAAVDSVIENGVTEDQAVSLATSEKVLQSVDGDQATEIFAAVDITNVTPEEAAQLVNAVQDAPTEVRSAFEEEINVFDGAVDSYQPLGSAVNVGQRRVVVAVGAVLSSLPTLAGSGPMPSSGGSTGGGGSPSGGGDSSDGSNNRRRRGAK
jgi:uncharacterized membrane protein YgcG